MFAHYTIGPKLPLIRRSQALLPLGTKLGRNEEPLLWFSTRDDFEPTAIKPLMLNGRLYRPSFGELHALVGCFRFVGDLKLMPYAKACVSAKTPRHFQDVMLSNGLAWGGDPNDWFATLKPVMLDQLIFEKWDGRRWVSACLNAETAAVMGSGRRVLMVAA